MARKPRNVNRSWFSKVQRKFARIVKPFVGKPITYVEIGVWRGDSLEWVFRNVLTHEQSFGVGIDPYRAGHNYGQDLADEAYQQALDRTRTFGHRCHIIRADSQRVLATWHQHTYERMAGLNKFDLLYIDGAHDSHSVLLDFAYAWPHLKTGSVVIFDDYGIGKRKGEYHVPAAVEAINKAFGRWIETIHEGMQYAIRVKEMPVLGAICR